MVGKILVVDDAMTNRIVMKAKLAAASYFPLLAGDGATCLRLARAERPDAILLDLILPDMSGISVLEGLRADPATRDTPVVIVSASADTADLLAAFRAGADDFIVKPVDDRMLLSRLTNLIAARGAVEELVPDIGFGLAEPTADFVRPGVIALITDCAEAGDHLRTRLQPHLSGRIAILGRDAALTDTTLLPDVYLIDADLGGEDGGLRLMLDLRRRASGRHAGMFILWSDRPGSPAATAFDLGAGDVARADCDAAELAVRLRAILRRKVAEDRMRASVQDHVRMSVLDPLTGLHNRRYGLNQLTAVAQQAHASGTTFAVMVVDIDHFKRVNDNWGHAAGDAVLVEIARRLKHTLRAEDLLARIGGEEFLIAIPATALDEGQLIAQRLRLAVEKGPVALPDGGDLEITVSIGLAIGNTPRPAVPDEPVSAVVHRADRALLDAKSAGRNQVTVAKSAA